MKVNYTGPSVSIKLADLEPQEMSLQRGPHQEEEQPLGQAHSFVHAFLILEKEPSKKRQKFAEESSPQWGRFASKRTSSDDRRTDAAGWQLQHDNFPHSSYRESPNDELSGQSPPWWSSDF